MKNVPPKRIESEVENLQRELEILESQERLSKKVCKICGAIGSDVISLKHRGPVHGACLK